MEKKQKKNKRGKFKSTKLIFKTAPVEVTLHLVATVLRGLSPTAMAIVMGLTVDEVIKQAGNVTDLTTVIKYAGLLCLLMAYKIISKPFIDWMTSRITIKLDGVLNQMIIDKHTKLAYWRLEDKESLDLIRQVESTSLEQFKSMLSIIDGGFYVGITIVSAMITITLYVWWIVPVTLAIFIPLLKIAQKGAKATYEQGKSLNDKMRYIGMLDEVLLGKDSAKERYLFDYAEDYIDENTRLFREVHNELQKTKIEWFTRGKIGSIIFTLVVFLSAIILLKPLREGTLTFGIYTTLIGLISTLVKSIGWAVPTTMDKITRASLFTQDFYKFFALEEEENGLIRPEETPEFRSIEFKNVSFTYPGTEREILKNMSFAFINGKHYSIVGENGSGDNAIMMIVQ